MSMLKPSVRLSAVIAALSASVVLLAAIDGASAKSSSNGNGGSRQPQLLNNIHPIISKPKNSDRDHDRKKLIATMIVVASPASVPCRLFAPFSNSQRLTPPAVTAPREPAATVN